MPARTVRHTADHGHPRPTTMDAYPVVPRLVRDLWPPNRAQRRRSLLAPQHAGTTDRSSPVTPSKRQYQRAYRILTGQAKTLYVDAELLGLLWRDGGPTTRAILSGRFDPLLLDACHTIATSGPTAGGVATAVTGAAPATPSTNAASTPRWPAPPSPSWTSPRLNGNASSVSSTGVVCRRRSSPTASR